MPSYESWHSGEKPSPFPPSQLFRCRLWFASNFLCPFKLWGFLSEATKGGQKNPCLCCVAAVPGRICGVRCCLPCVHLNAASILCLLFWLACCGHPPCPSSPAFPGSALHFCLSIWNSVCNSVCSVHAIGWHSECTGVSALSQRVHRNGPLLAWASRPRKHHAHGFCLLRSWTIFCSAEDFWLGYKSFCYAYYSHSSQHESEFRLCKLGSCSCIGVCLQAGFCGYWGLLLIQFCLVFHVWCGLVSEAPTWFLFSTGQLVWRRHAGLHAPSRQWILATCTQLLPLVEMFCKGQLEEDCSDLRSLMLRFDCEAELESHALGRSLLLLVRDGDGGFENVPPRIQIVPPPNPFDAVRARLSAIDLAIRGLHMQVHLIVGFCSTCNLHHNNTMALHFTPAVYNHL